MKARRIADSLLPLFVQVLPCFAVHYDTHPGDQQAAAAAAPAPATEPAPTKGKGKDKDKNGVFSSSAQSFGTKVREDQPSPRPARPQLMSLTDARGVVGLLCDTGLPRADEAQVATGAAHPAPRLQRHVVGRRHLLEGAPATP